MPRSLTVAFANIGRGTPEQTRDAIALIAAQMLAFDTAALLLNEVDEADTADEHGLLSTAFRKWEDHAWESREPILTKGVKVKRSSTRKAARGVTRQSPARPIHEVLVDGGDDPDIVLIGGHPPAGAKNGVRDALVRVLLQTEYRKMRRIIRKRIRHHRKAGRHVIVAMDFNWRNMPSLHRAEGELINHGPDYIRVIPARGWEAVKAPSRKNNLPIEPLHKLLWAVVVFRPVKHPSN